MFLFLCNVSVGLTLITNGWPLAGCAAVAGGLVWLMDAEDYGDCDDL